MLASTLPVTWIWADRSPAQTSEAVAPGSLKAVWHSRLITASPTRLRSGAWCSTTVMVNEPLAEPQAFEAVAVTVVIPAGK